MRPETLVSIVSIVFASRIKDLRVSMRVTDSGISERPVALRFKRVTHSYVDGKKKVGRNMLLSRGPGRYGDVCKCRTNQGQC